MANVYLVRQEHSYLYGDILDSAVIIADSVGSARKTLITYLQNSETPIIWDESMWAVTKLGNSAKQPPEPFSPIVCKNICYKDQLPQGNYALKKYNYK